MTTKNLKISKLCIIIFLFILIITIPKQAKTQEVSLWQNLGLYGGQITSIAIDPGNPLVIYAGSWGGDGLFKSTDGGATWVAIPQDMPSWFRNLEIYDIEIDPNNSQTIWVANNHYVDLSRDGGQSWRSFYFANDSVDPCYDDDGCDETDGRFCYSVAVDPFDSDRVYVGTGGRNSTDVKGQIFITESAGGADGTDWYESIPRDRSLSWNNFWQIKFNPNRQGEAWAANRKSSLSPDGMVVMTPDYGQTWWYWKTALWPYDNKFYLFGYIDEVLVHPTNPDLIFLSSGEGVARKTDGSALPDYSDWYWTDVLGDCRALCIPPAEDTTIYAGLYDQIAISKDSGATWDQSDFQTAPSEFLTLEPHPTDPATLLAGSLNQGIQKTTDRAVSWTTLNTGLQANAVFDTAVDPADPGRIMCATLAGIFLRDNATAAWKQINKSGSEAVAFHPTASGTLYAGFDWSIGKSLDSGASWTYLNTDDQKNSNKITSIALDTAGGSVYAAVAYNSGDKGQLLKIQDSSAPFVADATAPVILTTREPINAVAISPQDPSFVIAATGSFYSPVVPGNIYISTNAGQTWQKQFLFNKYVFNCIAFDPATPGTVYIGGGASDGSYQTVLKSTDGGATWQQAVAGLPPKFAVKDMKVTPDGSTVYAALYKGYSAAVDNLGGTYVSLDSAAYWTRTGLSDYRMYDITVSTPGTPSPSAAYHTAGPNKDPIITYTLYAGSASGLVSEDPSTIAGTGTVYGLITETETDKPISQAYINSSAGTGAQSNQGSYLMLCPAGMVSVSAAAPGYLQVSGQTVSVMAGEVTEHNILMQPFADNGSSCIFASLLAKTPESRYLHPLRLFRDSVLKKTSLGNTIISQYYGLGKDVLPVLKRNSALAAKCRKLLARSAEIITAKAGKPLRLPPGFLDEVSAFLMEVEKNAPPEVQRKLKQLRCDMRHFRIDRLQVRPQITETKH